MSTSNAFYFICAGDIQFMGNGIILLTLEDDSTLPMMGCTELLATDDNDVEFTEMATVTVEMDTPFFVSDTLVLESTQGISVTIIDNDSAYAFNSHMELLMKGFYRTKGY